MSEEPIFDPALEVRSLRTIEPAKLVRFASRSGEDELALTAIRSDEALLVVLNSRDRDSGRLDPFTELRADAAKPVAAVIPRWRIEPLGFSVTGFNQSAGPGTILIPETSAGYLLADEPVNHRSRRVAVCLETGTVLNSEEFRHLKSESRRYATVTAWKLWEQGEGKHSARKLLFEFPEVASANALLAAS